MEQARMRKLFFQINVSVDGFIEDPSGKIDWHFVDDEFEVRGLRPS
jgi:hypothetical protein